MHLCYTHSVQPCLHITRTALYATRMCTEPTLHTCAVRTLQTRVYTHAQTCATRTLHTRSAHTHETCAEAFCTPSPPCCGALRKPALYRKYANTAQGTRFRVFWAVCSYLCLFFCKLFFFGTARLFGTVGFHHLIIELLADAQLGVLAP